MARGRKLFIGTGVGWARLDLGAQFLAMVFSGMLESRALVIEDNEGVGGQVKMNALSDFKPLMAGA